MGRPPLPVGPFGKIDFLVLGTRRVPARASFGDLYGSPISSLAPPIGLEPITLRFDLGLIDRCWPALNMQVTRAVWRWPSTAQEG
jgi:hypothetical protein